MLHWNLPEGISKIEIIDLIVNYHLKVFERLEASVGRHEEFVALVEDYLSYLLNDLDCYVIYRTEAKNVSGSFGERTVPLAGLIREPRLDHLKFLQKLCDNEGKFIRVPRSLELGDYDNFRIYLKILPESPV